MPGEPDILGPVAEIDPDAVDMVGDEVAGQVRVRDRVLDGIKHAAVGARGRCHLLICMLAEYLRWHLRHAWSELLFQDDNPRSNTDPVAKATRSPQATRKAGRRRSAEQEPCHTLESLFDELENRTRNTIRVTGTDATFPQLSTPTELQARALALIDERVPQVT